jgi:hypothetical protein
VSLHFGTENQVAWAEQIRVRVNVEFDRVAEAFASVAARQTGQNQLDSVAVISILEEKRAEVMSKDSAGYFIQTWQDLSDQVRQLIEEDSRYQAIKADKAARSFARP